MKAHIIDDHDDARYLTAQVLELKRGFECTESETVEDALAHLETNRPDLVVTDYDTKTDQTGEDVLIKCQELGIPAVLVTGTEAVLQDAQSRGGTWHNCPVLKKPASIEDLLNSIDNLLGSAQPSMEAAVPAPSATI